MIKALLSTIIFVPVLLIGCATNSGVVPIGDGTYRIFKQGATGFKGSSAVRQEVEFQASEFCGKDKKAPLVTKEILGKPPYILGNFPKAEIHFKCVPHSQVSKFESDKSSGRRTTGDEQRDIYSELRKLKKLHDDGIITETEFKKKKTELLNK